MNKPKNIKYVRYLSVKEIKNEWLLIIWIPHTIIEEVLNFRYDKYIKEKLRMLIISNILEDINKYNPN